MTDPTTEERAEAERILGKCSCLEDYTLRKLTDPNCHWCEHGEEVMELIRERDKWKQKALDCLTQEEIRAGRGVYVPFTGHTNEELAT